MARRVHRTSSWCEPVTAEDYLRLPGVLAVEDGDETGIATLIVAPGCEGVARIIMAAQVHALGLVLHEKVYGEPEPEPKKPPARRRASTTTRKKP